MTRTVETKVDPGLFREPLRIAGRVFTGIPAVQVTIREQTWTGRGEAGGVFFLGDDVAHMLDQIEQVRAAIEVGADRRALQDLLPPGGARNALDAALWELEACRSQTPIWELAGMKRPRAQITTYTLGADSPDLLRKSLAAYGDARALKLKLDGDMTADIERIEIVHQKRPDAWLMVDANQGYDAASLPALMPTMLGCNVRLVEQPVARGTEASLDGIKLSIPLAADESVLSIDDLPGLVGRFQTINIKLDKCGGLTHALAMARRARQLGFGLMVGNMGGSSLAAAPAYLLAQLCDLVDLDGPKFREKDMAGGARYADGMIQIDDQFWGVASSHLPQSVP
ncbi:dipeptide epimerase [Sphingobium sp.]|uniref:dipeptide epimerase n=1 Tax=Sphingobium sp. TaxID=1912891 RepID=UPI002CBA6FC2|nr:dipeptide epimerase [Sphingobium sp.]HUD90289.1 dipeptide epimerase [Sphingobium sp.]